MKMEWNFERFVAVLYDQDGVIYPFEVLKERIVPTLWRYVIDLLSEAPISDDQWQRFGAKLSEAGAWPKIIYLAKDFLTGSLGKVGIEASEVRLVLHDAIARHPIPNELQLNPGILELLDGFAAASVPQAVVTSSLNPFSVKVLEKLGIVDRFSFIYTAENAEREEVEFKPKPGPWFNALRAIGRFGAGPYLLLEDNLINATEPVMFDHNCHSVLITRNQMSKLTTEHACKRHLKRFGREDAIERILVVDSFEELAARMNQSATA